MKGIFGGVGKTLRKVASGVRGNGSDLGVTAEEQERLVGVDAKQTPLLVSRRFIMGMRRELIRLALQQSRISEFEATYSRVILIRKSSLEILFVTPQLLTFCGMSCRPQTPSLLAHFIIAEQIFRLRSLVRSSGSTFSRYSLLPRTVVEMRTAIESIESGGTSKRVSSMVTRSLAPLA